MNLTDDTFVEVIVFAYNQEGLVAEAINSILQQEVNFSLKIRIHDDASTDKTVSVAESALQQSRFEWQIYSQESNQYSKGFQFFSDFVCSTKAKYVAFLDGDDLWTDPRKLQKQFDLLELNEEVVICHHPFGVIRGEDILLEDWRPHHLRGGNRAGEELALTNFIGASTVMMRADRLQKVKTANFNKSPVADYSMWALTAQGARIAEISEFMSLYREHDSNIFSGLSPEVRRRRDLISKAFILANIDKEHQEEWLEGILDAASWHLEVNTLKQELNQLSDQLNHEKDSNSLLNSELNSLLSSTSWKITSPIRKVVNFFRKPTK